MAASSDMTNLEVPPSGFAFSFIRAADFSRLPTAIPRFAPRLPALRDGNAIFPVPATCNLPAIDLAAAAAHHRAKSRVEDFPAMGTAPSIEGNLTIRLTAGGDGPPRVEIASSRPVTVSDILVGRPPETAPQIVGRLFTLCRMAQMVAAAETMEQAMGLQPGARRTACRIALVAAEALEQSLWRIFMDWPRMIGEAERPDLFKPLRDDLTGILALINLDGVIDGLGHHPPQSDWHEAVAAVERLRPALGKVFSGRGGFAFMDTAEAFAAWVEAGDCTTARLFARVAAEGLSGFGRSDVRLLADRDLERIVWHLSVDADGTYRARPDCHGQVTETGALARQIDHPVVAAARARHGNGLYTRLVARLADVVSRLCTLEAALDALAHGGRKAIPNPPLTRPGAPPGVGARAVDTARGTLIHWARIEHGVIKAYRILAPTEWNFHPKGPLTRGLEGSAVSDPEILRHGVSLMVAALDPCVAYEVTVDQGPVA